MPEDLGSSIFDKAIDTGFNIAEQGLYNSWASEREHNARIENYELNEKAAYEADKRARRMYEDFMTPQARLKMYQEAGLSPSLMFGDGAAAPQPPQGAQGGGASGVSPHIFGSVTGSMLAQNMERLAEARLKNTQADTIEGKNNRGQNEIQKLVGEVAYQKLVNEATEWDNTRRMLEVHLLTTYGDAERKNAVEKLGTTTKILEQQLRKETVQGNIAEKTEKDVIETIQTQNLQALANLFRTRVETELAKSNINLNEKQLENITNLMSFRSRIVEIQDEKVYMDWNNARKKLELDAEQLQLKKDKFTFEQIKGILNIMEEVLTFGVKNGLFGNATTIGFR